MNFFNKLAGFLRSAGLVPIGIIMVILGIVMLSMNTDKYLETTATVTSVEYTGYDEDSDRQYDLSFTYTVDGKQYEGTFTNFSSGYNEGDTLKIFYDPENPNNTTNTKSGRIIAPILIAAGAVLTAVGVFIAVKRLKNS